MNNQEKLSKLKDEDYQELFGVKKPTFDKMLEILEAAYQEQSRKGGRPLTWLDNRSDVSVWVVETFSSKLAAIAAVPRAMLRTSTITATKNFFIT